MTYNVSSGTLNPNTILSTFNGLKKYDVKSTVLGYRISTLADVGWPLVGCLVTRMYCDETAGWIELP